MFALDTNVAGGYLVIDLCPVVFIIGTLRNFAGNGNGNGNFKT